jgi:3-oxoacid CoA-transferase
METPKPKRKADLLRERIIRRAALEFQDGMYGILYTGSGLEGTVWIDIET